MILFGGTSGAEMTHCTFKYVRHSWTKSTADKLYNLKVVNSEVMDESSVCMKCRALEKYHLSSSKKAAAQLLGEWSYETYKIDSSDSP